MLRVHRSGCVFLSRGKAIQMHLGRLHVEVCPLRWADEALQKTHGGQALQMLRLWPQLLQIWPLGPAPTETHAGVNRMARDKEREISGTDTGSSGSGISLWMFFSWPGQTHTLTHTRMHGHTHIHTLLSVTRREDGEVRGGCGAQNRVTSGSSLGWKERTAGSLFVIVWSIIGNCLWTALFVNVSFWFWRWTRTLCLDRNYI